MLQYLYYENMSMQVTDFLMLFELTPDAPTNESGLTLMIITAGNHVTANVSIYTKI